MRRWLQFALVFLLACEAGAVVLPIEVVGPDNATATVTVEIPRSDAARVRALWMEIHNLAYPDMVSVQVNAGAWLPLNNNTAAVAEPGRSYGGIGGGFGTLQLSVPLSPGTVTTGANAIRFRFNHSDGLVSGFRILAFNFTTPEGSRILPESVFSQDDPNKWAPPRGTPEDIANGRSLWYDAALVANNQPGAAPIRAHCADCHARDGRDLKYFNLSNASIAYRSQFHGLSALQGEQIASYIRSLPGPNPGRSWNPPYQPGPGLDSQPPASWAAGAGLSQALSTDTETLRFLFPGRITPEAFRPDGNLNPREIPISLQLPDWGHWLPRVHPLDAWGSDFSGSDTAREYVDLRAQLAKLTSDADITAAFDRWAKSQRAFLARYRPKTAAGWSPDLSNKVYSTQLWQLVKAWELAQELQLEARQPRTWFNTIPLAAAPAEAGIPSGPDGMGASALTNEYFNNAWYEVQILVNSGNHQHHGRQPIDWVYIIDRCRKLYAESHRPEPARVLIGVIKALQSSDPKIGPGNQLRGWRPDGTVDPRIMVTSAWEPAFQVLAPDVRRSITEGMLSAWLDKNLKYRTAQYFTQGTTGREYAAPPEINDISGGKVWLAAPQFQVAGVSQQTIERLQKWGRAYSNVQASLHY